MEEPVGWDGGWGSEEEVSGKGRLEGEIFAFIERVVRWFSIKQSFGNDISK